MKFTFAPRIEKREKADVTVLPFWDSPSAAAEIGHLKETVKEALSSGDFKGKAGETLFVYGAGERILLLGLGKEEKASGESFRRWAAALMRAAFAKKALSLCIVLPKCRKLARDEAVRGAVEGVLLTNYAFNQMKGSSLKDAPPLIEKICWIGLEKKDTPLIEMLRTLSHGVYMARDLVNGNADDVTAKRFADTALAMAKKTPKLKAVIHGKKWLEQQKMGLILAVNRASEVDPCLIHVAYRGNPKSKQNIILVGKGVTYDTGGLALKTPDGMSQMKSDMAGAAAVLCAVQTAAELGLKVNVSALVPVVENCIDAKSYKIGDVYRSYSGKTVEVTNTDAEGRLILADALSYAVHELEPTCLIDLATLTGNIVLALGEEYTGLFTNDEKLAREVQEASAAAGELVWRMPLHSEYKDALKSDIADMVNSGGGREVGAIKAALFLEEFAGTGSWAHLDVAGPTFLSKPKHYNTTRGTGYGVRLLIEYLTRQEGK